MKKIIIALLAAALLLSLAGCVTRTPGGDETSTTTNLDDLFQQIEDELNKEQSTQLLGEVQYKVYDDHAEVVGCDTPIGDITIEAEFEGKKVTAIADEAFNGIVTITSVTIPEGVTTIGSKAFMGCAQLTAVSLPSTLTEVGSYAFYGCARLESIELPAALTKLGSNALGYCKSLASITVAAGSTGFAARDGVLFNADLATLITYPAGRADASYTIPAGVKTLSNFAFSNAMLLESVSMSGVTTIGDYTFRSCVKLSAVELGSGLKTLGAGTFQNCAQLREIVIPEGVESIGYLDGTNECGGTFCDCTGLTSITLPSTLKNVYRRAFDGCTSLATVNFNGTSAAWSAVVIGDENAPLASANVVTK